MDYINIVWFLIICYILIAYLSRGFLNKKKKIVLNKETKVPKIAILLPARKEEKVIADLLESIRNQTFSINMKDVYVIVPDENDLTGEIARKYGVTVIYRTTKVATKGKALDDGIKQIIPNHHYDLYFIFDADNILDKDYMKNILKSYYNGYDIATGYRNCKNGNENVVAGASALIFSIINTLINSNRKRHGKNIVISGTGFFIKGNLIEQWKGYPFQTLTEDYELSLYAASHGLKTDYVSDACFYDEQPVSYKQTILQRKRWVSGYFTVTKDYMKKTKMERGLLDITPIIILLCLIIGFQLFQILLLVSGQISLFYFFLSFLGILVFIYFVLFLITTFTLYKEKDKIDLKLSMKVKLCFYNPIFLLGYVQCVVSLIFNPKVEWAVIEHGGTGK